MSEKILFFVKEVKKTDVVEENVNDDGYAIELWKPSTFKVKHPLTTAVPFFIWWIFDRFKIFRSKGYGVVVIHSGNHLLHRSCIFPKYFRFPFMNKNDIQIGDLWTCPEMRGKGLATNAMKKIFKTHPNTKIWYLCEESNIASVKIAEGAGFDKYGYGERTKFLGISFLGQFTLTEPLV